MEDGRDKINNWTKMWAFVETLEGKEICYVLRNLTVKPVISFTNYFFD
jgi:hypothetical protein